MTINNSVFFLRLDCYSLGSVGDLDPEPDPDPHIFGPPGFPDPDPLFRGTDPDPDCSLPIFLPSDPCRRVFCPGPAGS